MGVVNIYDKFQECIMSMYRFLCVKKSAHHYFKLLKLHNIPKKRLTKEQKKSVRKIWGDQHNLLLDYNTHILAYSVTGEFNPMIMPESLFRTKIELKLNKSSFKYAWSDKNYFEMFFPDIRFPKAIVRNINGVYYDKDYNIITEDIACEAIRQFPEFITKPSTDSGLGNGVALHTCEEDIRAVLKANGNDFIVQEKFKQNEVISRFNPSSVNVIRYITIMLNGKVHPVMAALRVGAEGAINDASITKDGLGMFVIGIDSNGCLKDRAYYSCGKRIDRCPNGVEFKGVKIPGFEKN